MFIRIFYTKLSKYLRIKNDVLQIQRIWTIDLVESWFCWQIRKFQKYGLTNSRALCRAKNQHFSTNEYQYLQKAPGVPLVHGMER